MTLVFDYDGTIHRTAHLYGCAFRKAYAQLVNDGYAKSHYYSDKEMSKYLGMTANDMWNEFMPDLPKDVIERTSAEIGREMINQISKGSAALYDGIEQALDELKDSGYRMVILSNCNRKYMSSHREHFHLDKWFEGYFCAEDFGYISKEKIFLEIQKQFTDKMFVIIGDRESDFKVGSTNGFPTIGCAYGYGTVSELSACTIVISNPYELAPAVKKII